MDNVVIEYVWIGGNGELRSKTRVLYNVENLENGDTSLNWSYDGSSTNQVIEGEDLTEVYLVPRQFVLNPLRKICGFASYLLLCDTYDVDGTPLQTNNRHNANEIFERDYYDEHQPWFGLEQEYFMFKDDWPVIREQGNFYCGASLSSLQRTIVEEHLAVCLEAGLKISGINAEVAPYQWEFQVGPCLGIEAGDHMCIARYLLQRVAEKYDVKISFDPKPFARGLSRKVKKSRPGRVSTSRDSTAPSQKRSRALGCCKTTGHTLFITDLPVLSRIYPFY